MPIVGVNCATDGTWRLSNDANGRAWVAASQAAGYAIPFARARPLNGMGG
jgi:hypothetical protein